MNRKIFIFICFILIMQPAFSSNMQVQSLNVSSKDDNSTFSNEQTFINKEIEPTVKQEETGAVNNFYDATINNNYYYQTPYTYYPNNVYTRRIGPYYNYGSYMNLGSFDYSGHAFNYNFGSKPPVNVTAQKQPPPQNNGQKPQSNTQNTTSTNK
jgi:hypothetical protein